MIGLGVLGLLAIAVVVAIAVASSRRSIGPTPPAPDRSGPTAGARAASSVPRRLPSELEPWIERWVAADLLTPAQAEAIRAHEVRPAEEPAALPVTPTTPRRIPVVAEALGYLGGMLALSGVALVAGQAWPDWSTAARLVASGVTALLLLGAGALVRERLDPALARLRGSLWLAGTAACTLFAGVLVADALGSDDAAVVATACAGTGVLVSGLLWWRSEIRPLQQVTYLGGLVVFTGAAMHALAGPIGAGLAVWAAGAVLLAYGLRFAVVRPLIAATVGAVAFALGPLLTVEEWQGLGPLLSVLSSGTLIVLAATPKVTRRRGDAIACVVVGALMFVQTLPGTLAYFAYDAGAVTGLVTWGLGAALLVAGMRRMGRVPIAAEIAGALALIGGAALTGAQAPAFATVFGLGTAVALLALGTRPGQVFCSVFGSIGLLVFVPWAIAWFFPGENRAPLLVIVSGVLLIGVAVLLTRMGGRFRRELPHGHGASPA